MTGDIYEGFWANNKAHGHGVYIKRSGTRYEGQWVDDMQHGKGFEIGQTELFIEVSTTLVSFMVVELTTGLMGELTQVSGSGTRCMAKVATVGQTGARMRVNIGMIGNMVMACSNGRMVLVTRGSGGWVRSTAPELEHQILVSPHLVLGRMGPRYALCRKMLRSTHT